jgi:BirA family biotin operon repressor/biotin-[acetyl-CoA-carboxylase] ligase
VTLLDPERIASALNGRSYGRSIELKERTGSTNDDVREAAASGASSGHVIVADAQDNGRGAHGRVWSSPPGEDLYFSILERRPLDGSQLPWLTLAVGLGVRDAVSTWAPEVRCKWPNDVLIGERKCAGILVESSSMGQRVGPFVIGVGLDVNRTVFAPDLIETATSLRLASGQTLSRETVLADVLGAIEARVDQLHAGQRDALKRDLERHLAWVGQRVRIDSHEGTLLGIHDDGALRLSGGERILSGTLRRV